MTTGSKYIATLFLGAMLISLSAVQAQNPPRKPDETTRAEKARGGADTNVKQDRQTTVAGDKATAVPPPPQKAGNQTEKTRQFASCAVMADNWTGYWIDVYVDSTYRGTMPPWGELYTYAIPGPTLLYGRSGGGSLRWGPLTVSCRSSYVWRLDP
jgi:hypothetical protein